MKVVAGRKRTDTVLSKNSFAYSYKVVVSRAALIENNPLMNRVWEFNL